MNTIKPFVWLVGALNLPNMAQNAYTLSSSSI